MSALRTIAPILALAALAGCGSNPGPAPSVHKAWVRLAAVPGNPAAAYFTLTGGTEPARLVAIASPDVGSIELHESMAAGGGMTGMQRIDGIDIAPGADVAFAPGGRHAMLFGVDPGVRPGGTIKLNFRFAKGRPVMIDASTVAAGDAAPD